MSKDEITVTLTVEQAEALVATRRPRGVVTPTHYAATCTIDDALDQHRRKQKRDALGLPWRADSNPYHKTWFVYTDDLSLRLTQTCISEGQARMIATCPEAYELLERLLNTGAIPIGAKGDCTTDDVRAVLKKAGWL